MTPEFKAFPKIPRVSKGVVTTEKIDGTNACVLWMNDTYSKFLLENNDIPKSLVAA